MKPMQDARIQDAGLILWERLPAATVEAGRLSHSFYPVSRIPYPVPVNRQLPSRSEYPIHGLLFAL
jgi:hypothetical protein